MTDNRTTEHLRVLLDERGVEWKSGRTNENNTSWNVGDLRVTAKELSDGTLLMQQYSRKHLTPEQAIAATQGGWTCELVEEHVGIADSWPYHLKCSSCGAVFDYFDCYHKTGRIWLTMKHCKQCGRKVDEELAGFEVIGE